MRIPSKFSGCFPRLNTLFGDPPIVCHHDFSQCRLDVRRFPSNIRFVRPHLCTAWGHFSLVQATVACLRGLVESPNAPDWIALLSGADYPVAPAAGVLADLRGATVDAFLEHEWIDPDFAWRYWHEVCLHRFYLPNNLHFPFSDRFRCFAGSQWFTLNRRCVEYILDWHDRNPGLELYYRQLHCSDESYFHCILCNEPSFRIANNNKRYINWDRGPEGPRVLDASDLFWILQSDCHFARKWNLSRDPGVYDALDEAIG